ERLLRHAVPALDGAAHEPGKIRAGMFAGEEEFAVELGCSAIIEQGRELADQRAGIGAQHEFLAWPMHHDSLSSVSGFGAGKNFIELRKCSVETNFRPGFNSILASQVIRQYAAWAFLFAAGLPAVLKTLLRVCSSIIFGFGLPPKTALETDH